MTAECVVVLTAVEEQVSHMEEVVSEAVEVVANTATTTVVVMEVMVVTEDMVVVMEDMVAVMEDTVVVMVTANNNQVDTMAVTVEETKEVVVATTKVDNEVSINFCCFFSFTTKLKYAFLLIDFFVNFNLKPLNREYPFCYKINILQ